MGLLGGDAALPGVVTGSLLFIPTSVWVWYACLKSGSMTSKGLAVSFAGGIAGHLCLGAVYGLFKLGVVGITGMLAIDVLTAFLPILVAGAGSRLLGPIPVKPLRTATT